MNPDFLDILRALCAAEARFLVIGAYAVSVHAEPRATVPVLGRDALIANKLALGRPKDLLDVELLRQRGGS